jgi:hypothetical protein
MDVLNVDKISKTCFNKYMGRLRNTDIFLDSRRETRVLSESSLIEKTKLNVNDLIKKRLEEKKIDKKTNILIFLGVSVVAVIVLAIISFYKY